MTVYLGCVLSKKYLNPSADVITILAGLDEVDAVFLDFAEVIERAIGGGRSCKFFCLCCYASRGELEAKCSEVDIREKAVETATILTAGAWQTSLVSYFMQRDLFPALMKVNHPFTNLFPLCHEENPLGVSVLAITFLLQPVDLSSLHFATISNRTQCISTFPSANHPEKSLALLGLLANYNKFEFRNPYLLRLADYVNSQVIQDTTRLIGNICGQLRDDYITISDDAPAGWSISSTLSYVGLGVLAPSKTAPVIGETEACEKFASL